MRQVSGKSQIWNVEELLQEVNGKKWKGKEETTKHRAVGIVMRTVKK